MAWTGSGSYILPPAYSPEVNGTTIDATRYNGLTNDVATGISAALAKNGENTPSANLPMGGFKHTGVAAAAATGQYLMFGQNLGTVVADAGLVGTPGYTFNGDLNNGWWTPAADTQAWSLAGAEVMRLNSTGLGIGVTPLVTLHVKSSSLTIQRLETTAARGTGQVISSIFDPTGIKAYFGYGSANDKLQIFQALNQSLEIYTNNVRVAQFLATGGVDIDAPTSGLALNVNSASTSVAAFDSSNANGGYVSFRRSGVTYGYAGISAALIGGGSASDFAVMADNSLLIAIAGNEAVRVNAARQVLVNRSSDSGFGLFQVAINSSDNVADFSSSGNAQVNVRAGASATAVLRIAGNGLTPGVTSFDIGQDSAGSVDIINRSNTRMSLYANNTELLRLNADGSFYGTALHNNGGTGGATTQHIASGTYTPTLTNTTNIDSSTAFSCSWLRVGNVVTVSGQVNIDCTAAGSASTVLGISLPVPSNFVNSFECGGAGTQLIDPGYIQADGAADRAAYSFFNTGATVGTVHRFTFTYVVL